MKATAKGVTAKLFLGLPVTPDIKLLLAHSKAWTEYTMSSPSVRKLHLIHYKNKEYLGLHIEKTVTLNELKMSLLFCLDHYKRFLPEQQIEAFRLTIFPQIFIN